MKSSAAASTLAWIALGGLIVAGYLVFLHLGLMRGDLVGGAACGGSGALNCHAVTGSRWSHFFGIPLAYWGLLAYSAVFSLALFGQQGEKEAAAAVNVIWFLSLAMVAVDAWLLYVMAVKIQYFCLFCLLTYAVNGLLLGVAWLGQGAVPGALGQSFAALLPSPQRRSSWLLAGLLLVAFSGVAGLHVATTYLTKGTLMGSGPQIQEFLSKQQRIAISSEGDPVKGKPGAPLHLIEFSDFLCPVCQRASKMNAIILASHRDDLAFNFKNFPLDMECNSALQRTPHPGSCKIAAAGECANKQGKFWEFHDVVFEATPPYNVNLIDTDAARIGLDMAKFQTCMSSGEGMEAVKADVAEAIKAQVNSTPTFVLNDVVLRGALTPAAFDDFAEELVRRR